MIDSENAPISPVKRAGTVQPSLFLDSIVYEVLHGLWWDRICEVQRSNESPGGTFKRQRGLRQQMEGPRSDKF